MMRAIIFTYCMLVFNSFCIAQSEDLYKMYKKNEYEKCLKKCDALLEKDVNYLDAYWIKTLIYFEMAQKPDKWIAITDKPLQNSLQNLARIKSKDDDNSYLSPKQDTLVMIKEMAETEALAFKEQGMKASAVKMYKLIYRAFEGQENALQLAKIYILAEDYMECIIQIDKIYSSAKPDVVPDNSNDGKALMDGVSFLVQNFMFKDAFKMIEKYRDKFRSNPHIISSFKKAVYLTVDTLYTNKDKTLFFEYAQRGNDFYGDNPEYIKHLEGLCLKMIEQEENAFTAIPVEKRTWRDTVRLRQAFQYSDMSLLLLQGNVNIANKEMTMVKSYHIQVPLSKRQIFNKYADEVINRYRNEGCYCDSLGHIPPIDSLKLNGTLVYLANAHAKDMFAYNYTSNKNRRGQDTKARVDETDLKGLKVNTFGGINFVGAISVGENLGYGVSFKDVKKDEDYKIAIESIIEQWIAAKTGGSCERLMNMEFTDYGLGVYGDKWVLMFAQVLKVSDF